MVVIKISNCQPFFYCNRLLSSVWFLAWTVVFKIPRGARPPGFSSVNAFWTASGHYNGEDVTAMRDFTASSKLYKSKWLDDWNKRSFSAVCITICQTHYVYLIRIRFTYYVFRFTYYVLRSRIKVHVLGFAYKGSLLRLTHYLRLCLTFKYYVLRLVLFLIQIIKNDNALNNFNFRPSNWNEDINCNLLSIQKVLPRKKFRPKILSDDYLSLLKHGYLSVVRSVSRLIRITRRWRTWCLTAWVKVKTTGWTVGGS